VRPAVPESLPDFPPVETAPPQRARSVRPGVVVWDHLAGLEAGTDWQWDEDINGDDPLSATIAMRRTGTIARGDWRSKVETTMRMSCTAEAFRLQATLRAFDGDIEVCAREWDETIPRDLV